MEVRGKEISGIAVRVKREGLSPKEGRVTYPCWWQRVLVGAGVILGLITISQHTTPLAAAPKQTTAIHGTILDTNNDPITTAQVLLRNHTGTIVKKTTSQQSGHFQFRGFPPGQYVVTTMAPGFARSDKVMKVFPGEVVSVTIWLKIAAITDSVVVTATRTGTLSREIGASTTVIQGADLERAETTTILDALRTVPGLIVTQTGRRGGLTSIFARGGESDFNKVLLDGVPVNAAGGMYDFSALTPENIEQVEIIQGGESALYGSDAISSTIQLITRQGHAQVPEIRLSAEGGSFGFTREVGRFGGALGRFDYSSSFSYQRTDGVDFNDDYTNRVASGRFGFHVSDRADLKLTVRSDNSRLGIIGPTAKLFSDPDERQRARGIAVSGSLETSLTDMWHQRVSFVFSERDQYNFDPMAQDLTNPLRPAIPPGGFGVDFISAFRSHERRHGFHYQSDFTLPGMNLISVGADFERETGNLSGVRPKRDNVGIYFQDQWTYKDRLFLTGGLRIEHNTADVPPELLATLRSLGSATPSGGAGFGTSGNPRVSIAYFLSRRQSAFYGGTRLRFNYGTGIKEPTLVEAFSPNSFFVGNPTLEPERSRSFEIGGDQYFFGERGKVSVAYFDNQFRDLITFEFDPLTFGPVKLPNGLLTHFRNTGRSSARGVEFVVSARPHRQLWLSGSYTFLRSRLDRAEPVFDFVTGTFVPDPEVGLSLLRRPRHAGSLNVSWRSRRLMVNLDATFIGRRRDIDPVTGARFDASKRPIFNDGYSKLNVAMSYRIAPQLSLFTRIENLLNQDYQEVLGFPAYHINFSAGLRFFIGGDH